VELRHDVSSERSGKPLFYSRVRVARLMPPARAVAGVRRIKQNAKRYNTPAYALRALALGPRTDLHQIGIRRTSMSQYEFSVSSQVRYLPEESDPERRQYAFAYTLTIRNSGQVPAQLIARHWVITDSDDHVQEVKGLGVVGHQPLLKPGEQFEYTSWAVIATPVGTMRGEYFCVADDGERFEAPVPEFVLRMPRTLH
jgi:ApaG protein